MQSLRQAGGPCHGNRGCISNTHDWPKKQGGCIAREAAGRVKKAQAVAETLKLRKVSLCFYLFPTQVFPSCSLRYWLTSIPKSKSPELRDPGAVYEGPYPFGKRAFSNWEAPSGVPVRCQGHDRSTERKWPEFPRLSAFCWVKMDAGILFLTLLGYRLFGADRPALRSRERELYWQVNRSRDYTWPQK